MAKMPKSAAARLSTRLTKNSALIQRAELGMEDGGVVTREDRPEFIAGDKDENPKTRI